MIVAVSKFLIPGVNRAGSDHFPSSADLKFTRKRIVLFSEPNRGRFNHYLFDFCRILIVPTDGRCTGTVLFNFRVPQALVCGDFREASNLIHTTIKSTTGNGLRLILHGQPF